MLISCLVAFLYFCYRWLSLASVLAILLPLGLLLMRLRVRARPRPILGRVPVTFYPPLSSLPLEFPPAPIATTPLVRVLETIDLSSSDVQHFLEEEERAQIERELPITQKGSLTH